MWTLKSLQGAELVYDDGANKDLGLICECDWVEEDTPWLVPLKYEWVELEKEPVFGVAEGDEDGNGNVKKKKELCDGCVTEALGDCGCHFELFGGV